jgi:hypothetical protein
MQDMGTGLALASPAGVTKSQFSAIRMPDDGFAPNPESSVPEI